MDTFENYLAEVYEASIEQSSEKFDKLLLRTEEVVLLLLLLYGNRHIKVLLDNAKVPSPNIEYQPSERMLNRCTNELQDVLVGLYTRMKDEIDIVSEQNEGLEFSDILHLVFLKNIYQRTRILNSHTHILEERARLDVVDVVLVSNGMHITKTWRSRLTNRTCEACREMHGTTVAFDQDFEYHGRTVSIDSHFADICSMHSNCECSVEYNIETI